MVWPELGPRRLRSSLVMETMGPKARPARCFSKWQHLLLSLPTGRCFRGTVAPVQCFSHIAMRRERLWDQGPHSSRGQSFSNSSIHQHWEGQVSWAFGLYHAPSIISEDYSSDPFFSCEVYISPVATLSPMRCLFLLVKEAPKSLGKHTLLSPVQLAEGGTGASRWATAPAENRRPLLHLPWSVPARWPMPSAIGFLSAAPCMPAPRACLGEEGVESADLPDARPAWCQPGFNRPTPTIAGKMGSQPPLGFWKRAHLHWLP